MTEKPHRTMDELDARRVVLAHAIEITDAQGELLPQAEREKADMRARQEVLHRAPGVATGQDEFLALRARHVLGAVAPRYPGLAALQEPATWQPWVEWAVPLTALVMGVATDVIGNPHRVNLVSLPLLGIVAWNVWMYLLFIAAAFIPRKAGRPSWLADFGRWSVRRSGGDAEAQAATRFRMDWFTATRPLHIARIQRVLHLSAAAWAFGVILSLLVRGLVVEYRVGWESTFLGPAQVHSILSVLRWPALLVFPFDTFSVVDVAQMRFSDGGGAASGAPWVWMYAALLLSLVIIPRLLLATYAAWREERLAGAIPVDLQAPYAGHIESLMSAASIQLGLLSHRAEDRERFLMLLPHGHELPVVVNSPAGDVMRLVDVPPAIPDTPAATLPWWARLWPFGSTAGPRPQAVYDVIVHLVGEAGDEAAAAPVLQHLASPVVAIWMFPRPTGEGGGIAIDSLHCPGEGDDILLGEMAAVMPDDRRGAFGHVAREWRSVINVRLQRSMSLIAEHAVHAARQVEEAMAGNLSMKSLLPVERESQTLARDAAMARIVQRLDESARALSAQLRELHGVDDEMADAIEHKLEERFTVQQPVDAPQAGLAGAASGAAMGASIDLLAGGMTLGAAAALGALVGGGAAYIAAAWKNRASPNGATVMQLSDDMLDAIVEAALLRYLAIAFWARGHRTVDDAWRAEVVARVQAQRALLAGFWNTARTHPDARDKLVQQLAQELERMTRAVLEHVGANPLVPKSSLQQARATTRP